MHSALKSALLLSAFLSIFFESYSQCTCPVGLNYTCVPAGATSSSYPGGFTTSHVYFQGSFIVNTGNFSVSGITITCSSNASITINTGCTLNISNSTLTLDETCSYQWRGIMNYGALILSNSTIELASIALTCFDQSTYTISNSVFNKNWKGISFTGISGTYVGQVYGSRFQCLDGNTPAPIGVYPYESVRSNTGIDISGVQLVSIGIFSSGNTFDNLDYGIYSYAGCGAIISNNSFYRCDDVNFPGVSNPAAIHVTNTSGTPFNLTIQSNTIGSAAYANYRGIDVSGNFNLTVKNNSIINVASSYGSYAIGMTKNHCTINNIFFNHIEDFGNYGIYFQNNPGTNICNTRINIHDNSFQGTYGSSAAIYVFEPVQANYVNLSIYNHSGSYGMSDLAYGILIQFIKNAQVYSNAITNFSTEGIGMALSNNASVHDNTLTGDGNSSGIVVSSSKNVTCTNNSVSYQYFGYLGLGNLQASNLICNKFDNCFYGVYLEGVTNFGSIGSSTTPSDNQWTNIDPNGYGIYCSGGTNGSSFQWYVIDPACQGISAPATTQPTHGYAVPSTDIVPVKICGHSACNVPLYKTDDLSSQDYTETLSAETLQLFPNPATDFIKYRIDLFQSDTYELRIFDVTGKNIHSEKVIAPYGKIDISDLRSGCYVVELHKGGKMVSMSKLVRM